VPRLIALGGSVTVAALLLTTAGAQAGGSWGRAKVLDRERVGPPSVATAEKKGAASASWIDDRGQAFVVRFRNSKWEAPERFGERGKVADLNVLESDDGSRALAVWARVRPNGKLRAVMAAGRTGTRWGRAEVVMSGANYRGIDVSLSSDGERAVAVVEAGVAGDPRQSALYSATMRGSQWAKPHLITQQGEISDVHLVMDPSAARSVLAYQVAPPQGGGERIVVRDGSPAKWSAEQTVATGSREYDSLFLADAALGGDTVMVGWGRTDDEADRQASVSVRTAGNWSVQSLSPQPVNQISVGVANNGTSGLAVFQERDPLGTMAARAQSWTSGTWGAPVTIGSDTAGLGVSDTWLVMSRSGARATATWLAVDECCGRVLHSADYRVGSGWTGDQRVSQRSVRSYAVASARQGRRVVAVFDHPADRPTIEAVVKAG